MPVSHAFVRKIETTVLGHRLVTKDVYTLSPRPYKLLSRCNLPKSYKFESWENEDDLYFKCGKNFYNLRDFLKIGYPLLPIGMGGAQIASNGYFLIASYNGSIYHVNTSEKFEYEYN